MLQSRINTYALLTIQIVLFIALFVYASPVYAFRFVVYADSRAQNGDPHLFNHQVLRSINEHVQALHPQPEFVLFLGDAVNRSWNQDYTQNNLLTWKHFMKDTLNGIPFYVAVGNTDLYGNSGWTEYPLQVQFQTLFNHQPNNGPEHLKKLVYSFEYGRGKERSLFVVLDSFGFHKENEELRNFDNGYSDDQIKWFTKVARKSKARHKFTFTHGPAFSVEGFHVHQSVREIWKHMEDHHFDMFYCAHENIYSRWMIDREVYPESRHHMIQTIVGSAGAVPDPMSLVRVDPHKAHVYSGYSFVVVDVHKEKIIQQAYAVVPNSVGGYIIADLDKVVLRK